MLATNGDGSRRSSGFLDVVDESRERGDAADEESHDGAPVGAEFRGVAVHAVEVVHVRDGDVAFADDEVVDHEDGCHGS